MLKWISPLVKILQVFPYQVLEPPVGDGYGKKAGEFLVFSNDAPFLFIGNSIIKSSVRADAAPGKAVLYETAVVVRQLA